MRILKLSIVTLVLLVIETATASASVSYSVNPMKLEFVLNPGKTSSQRVDVTNLSRKNSSILIKKSHLSFRKNNKYIFSDPRANSPANWLTVDKGRLNIKPNETKSVIVKMALPKDVKKEEHYAAIMFQTNAHKLKDKTGTNIASRTAALVVQKLPEGSTKKGLLKLVLPKIMFAYQSRPIEIPYTLSFLNTGNGHFNFTADVKLFDSSDKLVSKKKISQSTSIRGIEREFNGSWNKSLSTGAYKTVFNVNHSGKSFKAEQVTYVISKTLVAALAAFLLVIIALVFYFLKKKTGRVA